MMGGREKTWGTRGQCSCGGGEGRALGGGVLAGEGEVGTEGEPLAGIWIRHFDNGVLFTSKVTWEKTRCAGQIRRFVLDTLGWGGPRNMSWGAVKGAGRGRGVGCST